MKNTVDEPVSAQLAGAHVLDEAGAQVALASLWREKPAVLAFLRHFG